MRPDWPVRAMEDLFSHVTWAKVWERERQRSVIARTQVDFPERWARFYDRVGMLWGKLAGDAQGTAQRVCDLAFQLQIVSAGQWIVDVGCGPGHLALAFAERGCHVKAIDASPAMIEALKSMAQDRGVEWIETQCEAWENLEVRRNYHVAVAAFFPPAFSPEGLRRLEGFARQSCVILGGSSPEGLPCKQALWRQLMGDNAPHPGRSLLLAVNTLWAIGRLPNVYHLQWPWAFDEEEDTVRAFYTEYFSIFGVSPQETERVLDDCLSPFRVNRRIKMHTEVRIGLLWWSVENRTHERNPFMAR